MQRERQIRSGKLLEVDFYPVFENGKRLPVRAKRSKVTSEEQQRYNQKTAVRKFVRLINSNFDNSDILLHVTYSPENAPASFDEAKRELYNYIRRIKQLRKRELARISELCGRFPDDKELVKKRDKLSAPFLYCNTLEENVYKTGRYKGMTSYHFHCFMTGGLERDVMEEAWGLGVRVNADRYRPDRFGPETAARYCSKDPRGKKRFCSSRGLRRPIEAKPRDGRITARGVERLAKKRCDDREYWENRYKGYRFLRCFARYNPYNCHWYVSVVMYRAERDEDIPPWGDVNDEQMLW